MTVPSSPTVLFVGPDGPVRDAVDQALGTVDMELLRSGDVATAMHVLQCTTPDLIVLDGCGPDGAHEGLAFLSAEPRTGSLPLLVLTDRPDPTVTARLMEAGADGYLPVDSILGALQPMATSMLHLSFERAMHEANARERDRLLQITQELGRCEYPEQALTGVASTIAATVPLSSCSIIILSPDGSTGIVATGAPLARSSSQ